MSVIHTLRIGKLDVSVPLVLTGLGGLCVGLWFGAYSPSQNDENVSTMTVSEPQDPIAANSNPISTKADKSQSQASSVELDAPASTRVAAGSSASRGYGYRDAPMTSRRSAYDPNSTSESNRRIIRDKMIEQGSDADEADAFTRELYQMEREFRSTGYISE